MLERLLRFLMSLSATAATDDDRASSSPSYLVFLNLMDGPESQQHAKELLQTCRAYGSMLDGLLESWLTENNWRPHLVGAVALVLSGATPARLAMLWQAIDRFSWASPQLVAAAALIDPEFEAQARQRIFACQRTPLPSAPEGESRSSVTVDPKRLAALVALCSRSGEPPWLTSCLAQPSVAARLTRDVDRGGEIALRWLHAVQQVAAAVTREPD